MILQPCNLLIERLPVLHQHFHPVRKGGITCGAEFGIVFDFLDRHTSVFQSFDESSAGGYTIVPTAVTYCAAKFYVSTFTEGLAWELKETGAKMKAKVLAPAATKTEFGMVANNVSEYDYDKSFGTYHTGKQVAGFLLELYDSEKVVGLVDRESFSFWLADPLFPYAGKSSHNQQRM